MKNVINDAIDKLKKEIKELEAVKEYLQNKESDELFLEDEETIKHENN